MVCLFVFSSSFVCLFADDVDVAEDGEEVCLLAFIVGEETGVFVSLFVCFGCFSNSSEFVGVDGVEIDFAFVCLLVFSKSSEFV